jgi:hypothetical protein
MNYDLPRASMSELDSDSDAVVLQQRNKKLERELQQLTKELK